VIILSGISVVIFIFGGSAAELPAFSALSVVPVWQAANPIKVSRITNLDFIIII
jgi:hypothetical protein